MEMPHIRIFPHSREQFESDDVLKDWLKQNNGEYWLKSLQPIKSVPTGSIVLFRFDKEIVGEAVVQRDIRKLDTNEFESEGKIKFEPASIRIYKKPLKIKTLEKFTGKNLKGANIYYKIYTWSIYSKILAETVKDGYL